MTKEFHGHWRHKQICQTDMGEGFVVAREVGSRGVLQLHSPLTMELVEMVDWIGTGNLWRINPKNWAIAFISTVLQWSSKFSFPLRRAQTIFHVTGIRIQVRKIIEWSVHAKVAECRQVSPYREPLWCRHCTCDFQNPVLNVSSKKTPSSTQQHKYSSWNHCTTPQWTART